MTTRLIVQVGIIGIVLAVVVVGVYLEIVKPFERQVGRM